MYWRLINKKEWYETKRQLSEQYKLIEEVNEAIFQIEQGNLNFKLSDQISRTKLANSLQNMISYLTRVRQEDEARAWFSTGLSFFLELIRNKDEQPFEVLTDRCLAELIKYVAANQGAIFILKGEHPESYLEMVACYAYNRKKFIKKQQALDQGLIGQAIIERDSIYLKSIPVDYVQITSGLGAATPRNVFITPLIINEVVVGVIELASFSEFKQVQLDFIKKVAENLASFIRAGDEKKRMAEVLSNSQQQTENLRSHEEELKQNLEEMTSMQEQLAKNENELKRRLEEMEAALIKEKNNEMIKFKHEENLLLESKLEAQRKSYELIIDRLKTRLKS
jgi:methyl-accepting chemotaxis protein